MGNTSYIFCWVLYFCSNSENRIFFSEISWLNLIGAFLFLILGKLAIILLSLEAIRAEGEELQYSDVFRIVSITQLGKYIPGGIWHFVGRIGAYHHHNISLKKTSKSIFLETYWLIGSAVVFGLSSALFFYENNGIFQWLGYDIPIQLAVFLAGFFIVVWFLLLYFAEIFITYRHSHKVQSMLYLLILQFALWFFLGLSFVLVFPTVELSTIPIKLSAYALSWVVGYLAIFAPGGIGIREFMLVFLLEGTISFDTILLLVAFHRFMYVIVELFLGFIAGIMNITFTANQANI